MIRFHRVDKNLYRGGALTNKDVRHLKDKYGIKKIVSLDEESGKKIDRVCRLLGIKHVMMPIDIAKRSSLLKFLSQDIVKLLGGGPTYVGCHWGKDRTSLAVALYRCEKDGWSCEQAIEEAKDFDYGFDVDPAIINLYNKVIRSACGCTDDEHSKSDTNNAYDIVSNQQSNPSNNMGYTLDALEQLSWSPYNDYRVREFPFSTIDSQWPDQYQTRGDYGLDDSLYQDMDRMDMPQIGTYDQNTNGINGAGPSMIGTGII